MPINKVTYIVPKCKVSLLLNKLLKEKYVNCLAPSYFFFKIPVLSFLFFKISQLKIKFSSLSKKTTYSW